MAWGNLHIKAPMIGFIAIGGQQKQAANTITTWPTC